MSREPRNKRPLAAGLLQAICTVVHPVWAGPDETGELHNKPREMTTLGFESHPPLFVQQANTLDPIDMAREAWKTAAHVPAPGAGYGTTALETVMFGLAPRGRLSAAVHEPSGEKGPYVSDIDETTSASAAGKNAE